MIKHEFIGAVRPYYDRPDIIVPVQWYFTNSPNYVPLPTAFANVIGFERSFKPHVGIQHKFQPNWVGNVGGFLGLRACGDADAWLNGVSFDNPPPPCECEREMLIPVQEVPAGTVDGSNRTFTLSQVPYSAPSLLLMLDGVTLTQGVDYSISSDSIYMSAFQTPRAGDNLLAYYWVET